MGRRPATSRPPSRAALCVPGRMARGRPMVRDTPVIGLAHGSRHPEGGVGDRAVMAAVGAQGGVSPGSPISISPSRIWRPWPASWPRPATRRAVVVPLLFTSAFHATVDVPEAVRRAAAAPASNSSVADILGTGDDIAELLADRLAEAAVPTDALGPAVRGRLLQPGRERAVADLATRLARRTGRAGTSGFGTDRSTARDVLADCRSRSPSCRCSWPMGCCWTRCAPWPPTRLAMVEPLGDRAAAIVLRRYDAARSPPDSVSVDRHGHPEAHAGRSYPPPPRTRCRRPRSPSSRPPSVTTRRAIAGSEPIAPPTFVAVISPPPGSRCSTIPSSDWPCPGSCTATSGSATPARCGPVTWSPTPDHRQGAGPRRRGDHFGLGRGHDLAGEPICTAEATFFHSRGGRMS